MRRNVAAVIDREAFVRDCWAGDVGRGTKAASDAMETSLFVFERASAVDEEHVQGGCGPAPLRHEFASVAADADR